MKLSKLHKSVIQGQVTYRLVTDNWYVYIKEVKNELYSLSMHSRTKTILLEGFELDELLDVIDVYV